MSNYPANIKSPQNIYIQYSDDIGWDWSSGIYPTGKEKDWNWEEKYIPVTHKRGIKTIGPHKYMRIKIGSGGWSVPIKLAGSGFDSVEMINTGEGYNSDGPVSYYKLKFYRDDSSEYVLSDEFSVQHGEASNVYLSSTDPYEDGTDVKNGDFWIVE